MQENSSHVFGYHVLVSSRIGLQEKDASVEDARVGILHRAQFVILLEDGIQILNGHHVRIHEHNFVELSQVPGLW